MRETTSWAIAAVAAAAVAGLAALRLADARGAAHAATGPWRELADSQGLRRLVHAAVLASNAHDTQPWRFALEPDRIVVRADLERHIGAFDPFRRELWLSLGCALENTLIQAEADGWIAELDVAPGRLPPQPGDDLAAVVRLSRGQVESRELAAAISRRRTHRGRFQRRPITADVLRRLGDAAAAFPAVRLLIFTGAEVRPLARLIVDATDAILQDRAMAHDNAAWYRFDARSVRRRRDGLTLDANIVAPAMNTLAHLVPPTAAMADRSWRRDTAQVHLARAPLLGAICVEDLRDRATAIEAGRLWQRLHLIAAAEGVDAQPLNQPCERIDREAELGLSPETARRAAQIVGDADLRPTFLFRMGYGERRAPHSPRRPVDSVIG